MSEKQTHPKQEAKNDENEFMRQAARASRKSLFENVGDFVADNKKTIAAVAAGAAIVGGVAAGQQGNNEAQQHERVAAAAETFEHDIAIQKEISEKAVAPVDPASIVGIFDIEPNTTIAALGEEVAEKQPEYQQATEAQQDFIDYTVLESAKAQGSYDLDDTFVVSKEKIDGKETFIVQDGEEVAKALTSPDTH